MLLEFDLPESALSVAFQPEKALVFVGTSTSDVTIWCLRPIPPVGSKWKWRCALQRRIASASGRVYALAIDTHSDRIFGAGPKEMHCWDAHSGQLLWVFDTLQSAPVVQLEWADHAAMIVARDDLGG